MGAHSKDVRSLHIAMHRYIYQISKEPIPESDWASNDIFVDRPDFLPVADSIDPAENRGHAIQRFGSWLEENQLGMQFGTSFILDAMAADRYFDGRFKPFKKIAAALYALTEEQYIHEHIQIQALIDELRRTFCNPFGDYMLPDETEPPITMDEFIRTAEPGIRYYIGGVLDYHC